MRLRQSCRLLAVRLREDTMSMTLPTFGDDWRCRWLYLGRGAVLHRVASIEWEDADTIAGSGATACNRTGRMTMPGTVGRLLAHRCTACCAAVGVPSGKGAPFNAGIAETP
jgi:hypothetical protein